jgi:hypothetical protein
MCKCLSFDEEPTVTLIINVTRLGLAPLLPYDPCDFSHYNIKRSDKPEIGINL